MKFHTPFKIQIIIVQKSLLIETERVLYKNKDLCNNFETLRKVGTNSLNMSLSYFVVSVYHGIALIYYIFNIYYDLNYVIAPKEFNHVIAVPGIIGRLSFLTYWCLVSSKIANVFPKK